MNIDQQKTIAHAVDLLEQSWGSDLERDMIDAAIEMLRELVPVEDTPYTKIVALYHQHLPMLAKVRHITDTRRRHIQQRWTEYKERRTLDWWAAYFARAARSDFLTGRRENDRNWRPDFDFFLQPKSLTRLLEGKYDNRGQQLAMTTRDESLDALMAKQAGA